MMSILFVLSMVCGTVLLLLIDAVLCAVVLRDLIHILKGGKDK